MSAGTKTHQIDKLLSALNFIKDIGNEFDDEDFYDDVEEMAESMMTGVNVATGEALHRTEITRPNQETINKIMDQFPHAVSYGNSDVKLPACPPQLAAHKEQGPEFMSWTNGVTIGGGRPRRSVILTPGMDPMHANMTWQRQQQLYPGVLKSQMHHLELNYAQQQGPASQPGWKRNASEMYPAYNPFDRRNHDGLGCSYSHVRSKGSATSTSMHSGYENESMNPRRNVAIRFSNGSGSVHDHIAHSIATSSSAQGDHPLSTSTMGLSNNLVYYKDFQMPAGSERIGSERIVAPAKGNNYEGTTVLPVSGSSDGNGAINENMTTNGDNLEINVKPTFKGEIILECSDRKYATAFSYAVLEEVESCEFRKRDITGKRHGLPFGFKGLACRHCQGNRGRGGRLFPSKIKTMSDTNKTLMPLYTHLIKCNIVPLSTKIRLETLKETHDNERKGKSHGGSQKMLFSRIWKRIHGYFPND